MPFVAATATSLARVELDEDEKRLIDQASLEDFFHIADLMPFIPEPDEVASSQSDKSSTIHSENFHEEKPNS